jgi:hypothetical protein
LTARKLSTENGENFLDIATKKERERPDSREIARRKWGEIPKNV